MRFSAKRQTPATKKALAVCLSIGLLMPLGCKSGGIWTPKMPKFGMPELAFGSKKKDDKIQPPAMSFSPDGDRTSIAQLPSRRLPEEAVTADTSRPRAPYQVDEEPGSSLADIARKRAEVLTQNAAQTGRAMQQQTRDRLDAYVSEGQQQVGSANDRFQESIANSNLLPSDKNNIGQVGITSIPGGPLGNPLGGSTLDRPAPSQDLMAQNATGARSGNRSTNQAEFGNSTFNQPSMPGTIGGNRSDLSSGLPTAPVANNNPFPPANTGLLPPASTFGQTPAAPNTGMADVAAIPNRDPQNNPFASTASVNFPQNDLPAPPSNSQLGPGAPLGSPTNLFGQQPPATRTAAAPTPAQPSAAGGFRPGSTGNSTALVPSGTTTQHPLSSGYQMQNKAGGGVNYPGVINNPHNPAPTQAAPSVTLPQYPSTNHGTFGSNSYPVQPASHATTGSNIQANGSTAVQLPNYPGVTSNRPALYNAEVPANKPPGMVCDGNTCYIPSSK